MRMRRRAVAASGTICIAVVSTLVTAGRPAVAANAHASSKAVTTGSNGSCGGTTRCRGAVGYDGPTGVGTPNGLNAF